MSIFVSVASYRDNRCLKTIKSLFEMAKQPDRVFVGICEQNTMDTDESCVTWSDPTLTRYFPNIRRTLLSSTDAEGPCYARYLCSLLYKGEDYFMQIDSHSLFVKDWDAKCIMLLQECPVSEWSILSYYPVPDGDYTPNPPDDAPVPVISNHFINDNGVLQWHAAGYTDMAHQNKDTPFIAAGFLFAPGSFVRNVPFDPNLPFLFMGEEALLTIRAYTAGYDIYTPRLNILYHTYSRTTQPNVYADNQKHTGPDRALVRAKWIMVFTNEDPPLMGTDDDYGLGNKRSLQDYYDAIGFTKEDFIIMPDTTTTMPDHQWYLILFLLIAGILVVMLTRK